MNHPADASVPSVRAVLTDSLLAGVRESAAGHDEDNTFPHDDLRVLTEAGYLGALAPESEGGLGWDLPAVVAGQRLLAEHAPATALAVNMHLIWGAVARILAAGGDDSLDFILRESAAGEIYAFGISEPGNDSVLFDSTTVAEPLADGSHRFTGTKVFTTGSPVWTRLGIFGKTPDAGSLVFGVLERSAPGWSADGSGWDLAGMRATHSYPTRLEGAVVPAERIIRRLPVGPTEDRLTFGIFAAFLTLVSAVYTGIGDRAVDLAAAHLGRRRSAMTGELAAHDPVQRDRMGEANLRRLTVDTVLRSTAEDLETGADHAESWFPRLAALKTLAVRTARSQVDLAVATTGAGGYRRDSEVARLHRDVVAGLFHPSDEASAHRTLAAHVLGPVGDA